MGMYDTLGNVDDYQVKCFDIHYPTNSYTIGCMGGSLRYYGNGKEVPYQSWTYNYGKDFFIIDAQPYDPDDCALMHIIVNGCYNRTLENDEIYNQEEFLNIGQELNCIDKQGVNIHKLYNIADIKEYILTHKKVITQINDTFKDSSYIEAFKNYEVSIRMNTRDQYTDLERQTLQKELKMVEQKIHHQRNQIWSQLDKWYCDPKYTVSNDIYQLGSNLECLYDLLYSDNPNYSKEFKEVAINKYLTNIKSLITLLPTIIDNYQLWVQNGPEWLKNNVKKVLIYINDKLYD